MSNETNPPSAEDARKQEAAVARKGGIVDKVKDMFKKPKAVEVAVEGKLTAEDMWNQIGYHRITGGVFYSYILLIGGAIMGLVTVGLIAEFLPYPEINGYKGMVGTLLGYWFGLADLNLGGGGGLSDSMGRFIGQYADTNPRKSMEYIKFYIWWQMITGLVQVTIIAVVCFTILPYTTSAYLIWMILAQSLVQYPGMLMIMEATLKSFQRGDKTAWLGWLQDTVFQISINILFLIIGKAWGASDPRVGEIMGITIWYILSQFVDDYINLAIGAKMFGNLMKKRGIEHGFQELFIPRFDKPVVVQCIKFVGKQWIANEVLGIIGYMVGLYVIFKTPSFASWSGLLLIPNFLGHLVSMTNWGTPTVPAISESYNNGKKELANYFIADMFKFWLFTTIFMAVPLAVLAPKLLDAVLSSGILGSSGIANYKAGIVMIPVIMIISASGQWRGWWGKLFVACDRPMPPIWLNYIFFVPGLAVQFLFLYLCVDTYILPVWLLVIGFGGFLLDIVKSIIGWWWFQKKIMKIDYRQMAGQAFLAPALTALAYAGVLVVFQYTIWPLLDAAFIAMVGPELAPVAVAAVVLLMILFLFPAVLMCPFFGLFGGFDDFTLEEFRKTMEISGPSKWLMLLMYKITAWFAHHSPLHNKFPLANYKAVQQQIQELIDEGKASRFLARKKKYLSY